MPAATDAVDAARALAAHGDVRAGAVADAILDVVPGVVVCPATADDVAACLAIASAGGWPTVLRGAGTKLGWGRAPDRVDVLVDLRRLNRVVAHRYGDLTATVEAGAAIDDVNRALAEHGQWLPIDRAFPSATIGGLLATNDSGPLRHRYGTPRDQLIGVTLATTDGRLARAGGQVVKNVAGYDLGKFVCGSHGTLAAIVSATFKLAPLPRASKTVVAEFDAPADLARAIDAIGTGALEPIALDLHVSHAASTAVARRRLFARFASTPRAVDAQIDALRSCLGRVDVSVVADDADRALWRDRANAAWANPGSVTRASWLPAAISSVLDLIDALSRTESVEIEIVGRALLGTGLIRVNGQPASDVRAIARLRAPDAPVRHVTLLRGSAAVRGQIDAWPPIGAAGEALAALKRAFDPSGILNAGRGPV